MLSTLVMAVSAACCATKPNPGGTGDTLYKIRSLSESELMSIYTDILVDGCRYSDRNWHTWSVDPRGGYWGDGSTQGNSGTRASVCMVMACGALLKYSDALTPADRADFLAKSIATVRFLTATHVTGTQTCIDGKKWGDHWGSAYCSGMLGFGAWLIWDKLDSELRGGVERVVAHEADRFLEVKIPSGRWGDTKAEENAWDQMGISIAARMFPKHPHAAAWANKSIEYAVNTLSAPQDKQSSAIVDGKPVSDWICTENIHPDFTLENHNIFHPSYMQCSVYLLMPSVMHCVYSRRPVPQGLTHHVMDLWGVFQSLLLPSGETIFPQGADWELHNLPAINLFANLATYEHDAAAAAAERAIIQYMRTWQQWDGGNLTVPGSTVGFTRHAIQCEQTATAYLAHRLFGPATDRSAPATPEMIRYYGYVENLLHRTQDKLLSFSWKNRTMGMIVPIGAGHEGNPFFTFPITNGLVGSTSLSTGKPTVKSLGHMWRIIPNGCETSGSLSTNNGLLKQEIKVTSLGEKTVVYQDRITALSDVSVVQELGVPVGIENDKISGGKRTVYYQDGQTLFDWQKTQQTVALPGSWANVDGRLGVVSIAGSGMAYAQAKDYNRQAVYADVLYGSFSDEPRQVKAGDEVAHRVVVFFTEVTPEETAALARSAKLENEADGQVLRLTLPEGGEAEVLLL